MQLPHEFGEGLVRPQRTQGCIKRAIEPQIDFGNARGSRKFPVVLLVIAAEGANVSESRELRTNEIVACDELGGSGR